MECNDYLNNVNARISGLVNQIEAIKQAAAILAEAIKEDRLLHVYGAEQESASLIASIFFTPGKPIHLNPILDPSLDIAHGSYRNTMCLEVPNLASCILDYYEYVESGDPILLIGSDPALIGFAESFAWAKAKDLKTITISCSSMHGADVAIETGSDSYSDGTYSSIVSIILELIFNEVKKLVPPDCVWEGKRFVDLDRDRKKIDAMLFRIKHL